MKKIILMVGFVAGLLGTTQAQNCPRYIGGDSTKTTPAYSIYREFFKKGLYSEALPQWKNIYQNASGFRKQTFLDGADMYIAFMQKETDRTKAQLYTDTLFQIYDKYIQCFGEDAYIDGRYAADLLKYGKNADIPQARKYFEKNIQLSGDNTFYFYLQTYFKLLINQLGKDGITQEYVKDKYTAISGILDRNIAKQDPKQVALYKDVKSTVDQLYKDAFYKNEPVDCAKLEEYRKNYLENPNDLENIRWTYSRTRTCSDTALNFELLKKLNAMDPGYSYAIQLGRIFMKRNQMDSAFSVYQNSISKETDSSKLADLYFTLATIKYEKNDFPASRDFAQKALGYNSQLGNAYLLIGTLYAASGKLCGPGTGFQSQIVLWPAFDYFKRAIDIGTEDVKSEAQKMISTYIQYLPTKKELTAKKLSAGASYKVACWIDETTTVKARENGASFTTPKSKSLSSQEEDDSTTITGEGNITTTKDGKTTKILKDGTMIITEGGKTTTITKDGKITTKPTDAP